MKKVVMMLVVFIVANTLSMSAFAAGSDVSPNPPPKPSSSKSSSSKSSSTGTSKAKNAKQPKLTKDGEIDYSYYAYDMAKYTLETYPIPEELQYDSKNPIVGQLKRDSAGRLFYYTGMGSDYAFAIVVPHAEVTARSNDPSRTYANGGNEYGAYFYCDSFGANYDPLYTGVGAPKKNQAKLENGRLSIYGGWLGWIPAGGFSGFVDGSAWGFSE